MDTQTPRTDAEQKWTFGDNRPGMSFECVKAEFAEGLEKELADSQKMLGMATELNMMLQNKADMWRDEFARIKALCHGKPLEWLEVEGICDRAMSDIRSNISLIDQREKAAEEIARLNDEAIATESLLRTYGWKEQESLQMFLHRTRYPANPLKHSPEYLACLLQDCEGKLEKATATLKAIFAATAPYADGAPDASTHDKLCNEIWCRCRYIMRIQIPRLVPVVRHSAGSDTTEPWASAAATHGPLLGDW